MDDIDKLKKLAGVGSFTGTPGSNISITGQEKADLQRKHGIKPGTDAWFKLWFSKQYLTGEKPI